MAGGTHNYQQSTLVNQLILGSPPPLGDILPTDWLQTLQELGNFGLVLLVFQGGLSTRLDLLKQNLVLSIFVALIGIIVSISLSLLSFVLMFRSTPLQGFTAGAALCSTSLGTTFAILSALPGEIDLRSTRIGTVLLSAAILDDVVGFIMASVVSRISVPGGHAHGSGPGIAWTILQPVVASAGMALITPPVVQWIICPMYCKNIARLQPKYLDGVLLLIFALSLSAMLSLGHYTESSMLFGAFAAGCALRYLDDATRNADRSLSASNFESVFVRYIETCNERILNPLFFSSVGMAIPFLKLWKPMILWKGFVYAVLMWLGKASTGLCILFWPSIPNSSETAQPVDAPLNAESAVVDGTTVVEMSPHLSVPKSPEGNRESHVTSRTLPIYPALFISFAMVARGEIALLVAQLGRSALGEDPFLIVM
ncbi:Sodium/hydrogen exchanger [Rickenella mellea]|uniref:Sodium/hydrogen exchanger n=1 Tax=Rickenella mellea TaxID=50990 RepID=A0A4Y7PYK6_9AGAM|nr:Sodium/hydrogen exchanger [Rickenella mellea]